MTPAICARRRSRELRLCGHSAQAAVTVFQGMLFNLESVYSSDLPTLQVLRSVRGLHCNSSSKNKP